MMSHPRRAFYRESFSLIKNSLTLAFALSFLTLLLGCHITKYQHQQGEALPPWIKGVVVVGFKVARSEGEDPGLFRCPICRATFMAQPVSNKAAKEMTVDLFGHLRKVAKGVYPVTLSQPVTGDRIDILQAVGKSFSADAVLFGYIYRL